MACQPPNERPWLGPLAAASGPRYRGGMTRSPPPRWTIVAARFHDVVVERLLAGATRCLVAKGLPEAAIEVVRVAGALELPQAALMAAEAVPPPAGLVVLGCVVRGETPHFDNVCDASIRGLMDVALRTRVPTGFGVLTCDTLEQALARAGGDHGDKGWEAAEAAWGLAELRRG